MVSLNLMPQIAESQFTNEPRHLLDLQAVPVPDDNCCWFFSETGFGGEKLQLCHDNQFSGLYPDLYQPLEDLGWDDKIQSYTCGQNVILWLSDSATNVQYETTAAGKIANPYIGSLMINNGVDVVLMFNYTDHKYMTLFYYADCRGFTGMFYYDGNGGSTQYSAHDLDDRFLGNDTGRSVMVPAGYQLDLYSDENLKGSHQRVYGLKNADGSMNCVRFEDDLLNQLTSFSYGPIGLGKAIGKWQALQTVNSAIYYNITYGVTTTESESDENDSKAAMTASMEMGVEFWGVTSTFSLSTSYEESFKKTVSQTTELSTVETIQYSCDNAPAGEMNGLWQWIVETEDGSYTARSNHAVCRSSSNALSPPACPWDACIDSECTQCMDGWSA